LAAAAQQASLRGWLPGIFPGGVTWLAVLAVMLVDTAWLVASERLSLSMPSLLGFAPAVLLLAVLALYCRSCDSALLRRIYVPVMGVLFIIVAFATLRVFDHLTMSIPVPFADDYLSRLDQAMGLNWLGYTEWVSRHPAIIASFQLVYNGLTLVSLLVFALLLFAIGSERAGEFARLLFWAGLATTVIGAALPAKAAMDRFASTELRLMFGPDAGIYPLPYLEVLRSQAAYTLDLQEMPGLVAIPSFHTICGLLIVYACRGHRYMWPVAVTYTTIMIASTPIMGGHYFIDLIAGALLTLAVIAIGNRAVHTAGRRGELPAAASIPDGARS
jgi:hypothetical protein